MSYTLTNDSKKCNDFILSNKIIKCNPFESKTLNKINNIIRSKYNSKYEIRKKKVLNKLITSKENCSLYEAYKLHKNPEIQKIIKNNNFNEFAIWYSLNQHKISIPSIKKDTDPSRTHFNHILYNNPFVSIDVHIVAEINNLHYMHITARNIDIHIYSIHECDITLINDIIHICNFMRDLANTDRHILLRILYCSNKKELKLFNGTLTPINTNSGSALKGSFINIWRKEELKKVLIHELTHYLYIDDDPSNSGYDSLSNSLRRKYNISSNVLPNEAFTETLAIIIHTIYMCYKLNDKYTLWDLLCREIHFSIFQCAKILSVFGIYDFKSFYKIKQTTSIMSYYIFKSALLYSIKDFLQFLDKSLIFENRNNEFKSLIINSMNNKSYINNVKYFMKIYKNMNNNFVKNTMRMSCIEVSYI